MNRGKRFVAVLVGACALGLAGAALAWGLGEIAQKGGAAGCISDGGAGGCATGRQMDGAWAVAVSGDGRNVYVASGGLKGGVDVFARNPRTGALSQLPGKAGCISEDGSGGCTDGTEVEGAHGVTKSPDGRNVYVATLDGGISIFDRNPRTGALTQKPGKAGCISESGTNGACRLAHGLEEAFLVTVSADGRNVYVTSGGQALGGSTLAIFDRNPKTGALRQKPGAAGCITSGSAAGCRKGRALDQAFAITRSSDGKNVYLAAFESDSVAIFSRNPKTGALTQKAGTAGCISQDGSGGSCATARGLDDADAITMSPNGKNVYVGSGESNAVAIFARNPRTGALRQLPGKAGCISKDGSGGCGVGRGIEGAGAIVPSPDGRSLYVGGVASDSVAVFDRNPRTGTLSQKPGNAGCISESGNEGCRTGKGLNFATALATSPDGRSIYLASVESDSVAIFNRMSR